MDTDVDPNESNVLISTSYRNSSSFMSGEVDLPFFSYYFTAVGFILSLPSLSHV